jgi:hypothetical protein
MCIAWWLSRSGISKEIQLKAMKKILLAMAVLLLPAFTHSASPVRVSFLEGDVKADVESCLYKQAGHGDHSDR